MKRPFIATYLQLITIHKSNPQWGGGGGFDKNFYSLSFDVAFITYEISSVKVVYNFLFEKICNELI